MSALYGAAGRRHDPELTRALLEAGANPDDGESLYHSTESESPECTRILLEHGAQVDGTNAIAAAIDDDRIEHVRLMLEHGGDPNEHAFVAHAVRRGCGPAMIELLVSARGRRRPAGRRDLARRRTAADAVPARGPARQGRARGAAGRARRLDRGRPGGRRRRLDRARRATGGAAAGDARSGRPGGDRADGASRRARPRASTSSARASAVSSAARRRGRCSTTPPGSARRSVVERLLARGADPVAPSGAHSRHSARVGGARIQHHDVPDRDFVGVAERLVAAGAELEPQFLEFADGPLAEWLQRDEHRVAERVEAVALLDREPVEPARLLDARERHHEREQRRARQVEVRQQRVDAAELEARRDEERRAALEQTVACDRLEHAHRRRADGEHALGGADPLPRLGPHRVALAVQLVLLERRRRQRPEGVEADVERDALDVEPLEQLGREVEAGGRSGGGARLVRVDGLVARRIGERLGDVRRQRRLTVGLAVEPHAPAALAEVLDAARRRRTGAPARSRRVGRASASHSPPPSPLEQQHLAPRPLDPDPRRHDPRVVDDGELAARAPPAGRRRRGAGRRRVARS